MPSKNKMYEELSADSFLEYAFLRWVLSPATQYSIIDWVEPQSPVKFGSMYYRIDYAIIGQQYSFAIELDGRRYHEDERKDKLRQQKLEARGWIVIRFSYESIIYDLERSICQLHHYLSKDSLLKKLLVVVDDEELEELDEKFIEQEWYNSECGMRRRRFEILGALAEAKQRSLFPSHYAPRFIRNSVGRQYLDETCYQAVVYARTELWELFQNLEGDREGEF